MLDPEPWAATPGSILIQDAQEGGWLQFRDPIQVIRADHPEEVVPALQAVERATAHRGQYAAGLISYEAAPAFDPALRVRGASGFPLLWFGVYPGSQVTRFDPHRLPGSSYQLGSWRPSRTEGAYTAAFSRIKEHIARGDTYQVNYTLRLRTKFSGDPWSFFLDLIGAQASRYGAYLNIGQAIICSASPELFFRLSGDTLISRPMKGTAARGRTLAEDRAQAEWLHRSPKNRAENVMIVDMIRNDLGRIAEIGSIKVPRLFEIERYPTLWQMTSTVTAKSRAGLPEIMGALFPCASITGAPKVRTMEIIAALETAPRRIYTGSIGFLAPSGDAQFNVAIRTVLIDAKKGKAEYGVGGGVVWDSRPEAEYEECRIKARVLTARRPPFELLETLRWTPAEGYFLLERHLHRLAESAEYFGFPLDPDQVRAILRDQSTGFQPEPLCVRLCLPKGGRIRCEASQLTAGRGPVRLGTAISPIDSSDPFLFHKTTHRQVYEQARAGRPDCDDVLLWNERGEITETTIANIVVQWKGELLTPLLGCGLLPGTLRGWLLEQGVIQEAILPAEALYQFERIYLINSVRGWREAILSTEKAQIPGIGMSHSK